MKNLILIGGNRLNEDEPLFTIKKLVDKKNIKLSLITDKVHLKKLCSNNKSFLFFLKKNKIKYHISESVNKDKKKLKKMILKNHDNILLLAQCPWKISSSIIKLFKNKIFNYHIGKLPSQKGAGGATWIRLNNSLFSALSIHRVNNYYDSGNLIFEKKFNLKKNFSIIEYYKKVRKIEKKFFNKALNELYKNKKKKKIKNRYAFNMYMPRLSTNKHGYINWSWDAKEIVDFIDAFGSPHEGAKTFVINKKFYIKKAIYAKSKIKFHPFQYGIVFDKKENYINVAAKNGIVKIYIIKKFGSKKNLVNKIIIGSRFFTSSKYLEEAMKYKSIFNK